MFFKKSSMIASFKIFSILFVSLMMCIFLGVLFTSENVKENVNQRINVCKTNICNNFPKFESNSHNTHDNSIFFMFTNTEDKYDTTEETCYYGRYMMYYSYALILGAFLNVKKLYKMGTI